MHELNKKYFKQKANIIYIGEGIEKRAFLQPLLQKDKAILVDIDEIIFS